MNVTLSIEDEVIRKARRRAEAMGTSVNQLVRDYLEQLAGKTDPNTEGAEFEQLSRMARGKHTRMEVQPRRTAQA
jgi:hypothetical protein